jgi:TolB-like protein/class 3 adenylate cyclase
VERKLVAILSADVKGYSRLMGEDEEATILTLTTYRGEMARLIQQHRGRVVDSPGDNLLAEFASVVEAVQCAVAIQRELKTRNAALPLYRRMEFRIGINLGDVIVEGERIYGDGVNIAARLEGLAAAGGVCVSGTVFDQIKNKLALGYKYAGTHAVKNIAEPLRVYRLQLEPGASGAAADPPKAAAAKTWRRAALVAAALLLILGGGLTVRQLMFRPSLPAGVVPSAKATALALPDKPSIAVLPFVNMSGDPEQEYFSDGMTEDLITDLSKLSGLFVIARNSVFMYKGKAVKPEQVGRELGVRYVLEGSVRRAANRVRITAQLVDASTGYHRWAERYDRDLKDIFTLQDEITHKIVAGLAVTLKEDEQERLGRKGTDNLAAYDAYLRGLEYYWRLTEEANVEARRLFERAIDLDPKFVRAYAALGRSHLTDWMWQWSQDPQTLEWAFGAAQRAVALDDASPIAHQVLGEVYLWKQQHDKAIAEAERAVALDPNDAEGYALLAEILTFAGEPHEAIRLLQKAMRLSPYFPIFYELLLGHAYLLTERHEEAITALKRALIRNPNFLPAHAYLAVAYYESGRKEEARDEMAAVLKISPQASGRILPYKDHAVLERLHRTWDKATPR